MSLRESYLQARLRDKKLKLVRMGDVDISYFGENASMGTKELCGCSVVVIASPQCAILAHIKPLRVFSLVEREEGDFDQDYVQEMMEWVGYFYRDHEKHFQSPTARVICARLESGEVLPGVKAHRDIMQGYLQQIGLSPSINYYTINGNLDRTGQGTVVVDGPEKPNDGPVIYLEDIQI